MFDQTNPEYDGSAQSNDMTPNQKMLQNIFGYFNKISITTAQEKIKIRVEKPNGMRTYLRVKQEREEKEKRTLTSEECLNLQDETMYNSELIEAGNSTEILRTLLRFVTANDTFQKQIEECIKEAFKVANTKATAQKFIESSAKDDMKW